MPCSQNQMLLSSTGTLALKKPQFQVHVSFTVAHYIKYLMFGVLLQDDVPQPKPWLTIAERENLLEQAKIYEKTSTQPLSNYRKQINEAAGNLALQDPSLLARRGDFLELARSKVHHDGYNFVKGKSRSKRFASPTQDLTKPTRAKISSYVRQARVSSLKEDIANIEQQLVFKDKRRQQAESVRH